MVFVCEEVEKSAPCFGYIITKQHYKYIILYKPCDLECLPCPASLSWGAPMLWTWRPGRSNLASCGDRDAGCPIQKLIATIMYDSVWYFVYHHILSFFLSSIWCSFSLVSNIARLSCVYLHDVHIDASKSCNGMYLSSHIRCLNCLFSTHFLTRGHMWTTSRRCWRNASESRMLRKLLRHRQRLWSKSQGLPVESQSEVVLPRCQTSWQLCGDGFED